MGSKTSGRTPELLHEEMQKGNRAGGDATRRGRRQPGGKRKTNGIPVAGHAAKESLHGRDALKKRRKK